MNIFCKKKDAVTSLCFGLFSLSITNCSTKNNRYPVFGKTFEGTESAQVECFEKFKK
jgi:hypothetical protein